MQAPVEKSRITSIDIVRGGVMVIMALDHTRDFLHHASFVFSPTDLGKTTLYIFFTRWITHFCAPAFVFLAGTSIYLRLHRRSRRDTSFFLLTRGLWLVLLELTVMRFALLFNFYYDVTIFGIIGMIGICMLLMAALIHLSDRGALILGLIIILGCGMLPNAFAGNDFFAVAGTFFFGLGLVNILPGCNMIFSYSVIPWLGIMLLGYSAGRLYKGSFDLQRRKILYGLGFMSFVLFVLIRLINGYGDPAPWSVQRNFLFTAMSFFNVTKYPVSLQFTLLTLGPVMVLLAALEGAETKITKILTRFGRVPLFYFIVHFYVIHITALILLMLKTGKSFAQIDFHFAKSFGGITSEGGYSLPWVYVAWIVLVVSLYPLCKIYERYKSTHSRW
jgi:uncharacterized membrane protein